MLCDSMYKAQKIIKALGLDYEKIDACANDCILYDYKELDKCPICGKSKWQESNKDNKKRNNIPNNLVYYFPIKPRLQRLFMSK